MRSDIDIQADVAAELKRDPRVKSTAVGVIVKGGAVTLTGVTDSYLEKVAAERAAKRVKGVRAVAADLAVRLPVEIKRTDEGIAEQIARFLSWNSTFRDTNVQAEVRNGRVTLTGTVRWLYQKDEVERRVEELDGVLAVYNQITIVAPPVVDERELHRTIMAALHRHANVEASKVNISISDGTVTLDGTVGAYHERDVIENAIRTTAGVTRVVDNLHVG
jgi:osmotically-inducible protein OsmY